MPLSRRPGWDVPQRLPDVIGFDSLICDAMVVFLTAPILEA